MTKFKEQAMKSLKESNICPGYRDYLLEELEKLDKIDDILHEYTGNPERKACDSLVSIGRVLYVKGEKENA